MLNRVICVSVCVWLACSAAGCKRSDAHGERTSAASSSVAVSNSYLEAAVLDILGKDNSILRLADPGMCPGHFDIRPSQVNDLRHCRLLLRFEFQKSLDSKLSPLAKDGLSIREIRVPGGLCEPPSYVDAVRQVADALVNAGLLEASAADERCRAVEERITAKGQWCRDQLKKNGWSGQAVLCSAHQEAFCRWLGLEVAATFSGADTATVSQIERAIRAGEVSSVNGVIANLPEGRRLADALGSRLGAPVVVFGNFPTMEGDEPPFDALLTSNVSALTQEAKQ